MLKKISLSVFLLPLLAFSALYANTSYSEEQVKLILPEEEREQWAKEIVETDDENVHCEVWTYQPSSDQEGKVILVTTQKMDWSEHSQDYTTIIHDIREDEIKDVVGDLARTLGRGPSNDEIEVTILFRTGSEIMVFGKYEQGIVLVRLMYTPNAFHSLIFSSWGEECAQEKWVEILKNVEPFKATVT